MKDKNFLHNYWKNPCDSNKPRRYLSEKKHERTKFLMDICSNLVLPKDYSVLEIGSNIGRNLNAFWEAGCRNLHAIEINENAVREMIKEYPHLRNIDFRVGSIEKYIKKMCSADVVLSMTVLMHIHPVSDWIFEELFKKTRHYLITIEDEADHNSERIISRNYKDVFENIRMKHYTNLKCFYEKKDVPGLNAAYTARMFTRPRM